MSRHEQEQLYCKFQLDNTVLQIRRGNRDNLGSIIHISPSNVFCDPSLEPSHRDGSTEGSQPMFLMRNKKNNL